ncbi:hypothetical protein PSE10A_51490 [Pseudomonas amygdali pv. eriobotryae]|uniref:Uncharacterized protein n=1 Tax=Pseudomonas amygdali pv. eriobotryae TaxID=129137 RepID=A0A9P3AH71_PSEA0|nr:hypothetical protein PSE10A_51490 [Pseudomonas amygdali pv. eriobotryae]
MPQGCLTPLKNLPKPLMNKAISDLSSHTPMMQQYGKRSVKGLADKGSSQEIV